MNDKDQYGMNSYMSFIHLSRYARWVPELNRRETWLETVTRYFDFFEKHLKANYGFDLDAKTRETLQQAVLTLKVMPSMRCLMTAGEALEKEHIAGYNCSYVAVDSPRAFDEILYILMNGCFSPDTLIKTRLGDKRIDALDQNDEVLSYNMETGQYEYVNPAWVIPTPHSAEKPKLELEFEDGSVVRCTEDHEFFTTNRGWVKAKDLTENDDVKNYYECTSTECAGKLVTKTALPSAAQSVYWDMTIPGNHNYVLGNGCVVHNTGVGFSVESQYVEQLPRIAEDFHDTDTCIIVRDSKLGWAKALKELLAMLYAGQVPTWDISKVRPAGAPLKTFGGRASGPEPLVDLFKFCVRTFKNAAGRRLTTLECHDIVCKIAEIVVVGGVRRSALISLSDLYDDRMRHAKNGEWWNMNSQRALSNNSYVAQKERPTLSTFIDEWKALYESKSGERGVFSRYGAKMQAEKTQRRDTDYDFGTNPCCLPGDTPIVTTTGNRSLEDIVVAVNSGEPVVVLGYDCTTHNPVWADVIGGQSTRLNAELIELTITDEHGNDHTLQLTPDHRVYTSNRGYVMAADSTETDEVVLNSGEMETGTQIIRGKVKRIAAVSNRDTYDIQTTTQNFFANGVLVHNSEIILRSREFCNLSEVVVRADDTVETLKDKVRLATILGTFQSTLTNFGYISKEWKKNCEEERLLGVSLTGIMDSKITNGVDKGLAERLEALKAVAVETNKEWAQKLGISQSVAITCVKPSGCTTLDTVVRTEEGEKTLAEIFGLLADSTDIFEMNAGTWIEPSRTLRVYDKDNVLRPITKLFVNGFSEIYELTDEYGKIYKFTGEHKLLTTEGWKRVDALTVDDDIVQF